MLLVCLVDSFLLLIGLESYKSWVAELNCSGTWTISAVAVYTAELKVEGFGR
ncbi:hypothetical protein M758_1G216200 [Ceratodon purpureus]|uniref:Uncharacterized protein n=1 Tax=Ceratodon purpureus TaxID=3225 RepID=A0A8T0JAS8_CERPU|nr:hypothetical protein KC19_1G204000 [Ceratodon purpureus]KAG0630955.1 hypothetical protein M758_1G216200 [Ceratodon purpureus]